MIDINAREKLITHKKSKKMQETLDSMAQELQKQTKVSQMPKETDNQIALTKYILQRLDFQSVVLLNIYKELKKISQKGDKTPNE